MGAYYEHVTNAQPGNADSNSLLEFATWQGGSSGNTFADLLMGGPLAGFQESTKNPVNDMHYNLGEAYIQDSWKMKPRFTLDYGLRFSYFGPWTDNAGLRHQLPGYLLHGEELEHAALRRRRQLVLRDPACRLRLGPQGDR
jgi:hypothetical protein